ncbi:hypothetical protein D6C90_02478 [Aureobasidium pullulans]|uniref:Uncharacterized protein n=1 Tax=Aureobasidium pullulans TaxID=5580 RepID=A0A4S9VF78_AURPU|nr:hypothetical protein D6C90_02478 [Aureobasidium pullulans]
MPAPLNVTPSRARNKLALRLAARKKEAEESSALENEDPDTADAAAIQQAFEMPVQPLSDLPDLDLSAVTERQINELIGVQGGPQAQAQAQDRNTTQAEKKKKNMMMTIVLKNPKNKQSSRM